MWVFTLIGDQGKLTTTRSCRYVCVHTPNMVYYTHMMYVISHKANNIIVLLL